MGDLTSAKRLKNTLCDIRQVMREHFKRNVSRCGTKQTLSLMATAPIPNNLDVFPVRESFMPPAELPRRWGVFQCGGWG